MKIVRIVLFTLIALGLIFTGAFASGAAAKGKALFNDPKFADGVKACSECHPDGKGLQNAADKKEFNIMGKKQNNLEEAVNFCIENANKGKPIDVKSEEMKDIVAYIKSLKKAEESPKKTQGY